ncbi:o-succinylbenzoate synthase [Alteribacillus iranensis]|uniref:o-succinylbenzoate synthase n=1 Tax=Alteribacillus iranensis TaxID=930128 RepID=A0A1I1ZZA3_9BACI|nr:o-succinylbenzoate synthase [Alteribacillus iranensis]SFE37164.1 O-succinylbenzoate synthase [Alteribacillus iranensis]
MKLSSIHLRIVKASLKKPFVSPLYTVKEREAIIVEARDTEGRVGYGEAVPFASPWYTEETLHTCWHMLEDFLIPLTFRAEWGHPSELPSIWSSVKRNNMAKSALEQSLWDLHAKKKETYIGRLFGGERTRVSAGTVVTSDSPEGMVTQISERMKEGYSRYKVKISPENDIAILQSIREAYPHLPLMADANSTYSLKTKDLIKRLDPFHLLMIEQPLSHDDIVEHAELQKYIDTPICLDESIHSVHDVKSALMLGSCQIFTVKMAKLGGWNAAAHVHHLCSKQDISLWVGGMIEFGVSRAHNLALATLPGFTIPGDISSSSTYWEEDIIDPEIVVNNGKIKVPDSPGIGFAINNKRLNEITMYSEVFSAI